MTFPSNTAINKCMAFTTTEAAVYLYENLNPLVQELLPEDASQILQVTGDFLEEVLFQNASVLDPWQGAQLPTKYQQLQTGVAKKSAETLGTGAIACEFAISDTARVLSRYTKDGHNLNITNTAAMDKLFNAWLAKHDLHNPDGTIYKAHNGEVLKDNHGNMMVADAEEIRAKMLDPIDGFAHFIEDNNNSLNVKVNQIEYPSQEEHISPTR